MPEGGGKNAQLQTSSIHRVGLEKRGLDPGKKNRQGESSKGQGKQVSASSGGGRGVGHEVSIKGGIKKNQGGRARPPKGEEGLQGTTLQEGSHTNKKKTKRGVNLGKEK